MKASPPRRDRNSKRESRSKWETDAATASVTVSSPPASKWDALDAEADESSSRKKSRSKVEEDIFTDLDGTPMVDSSPEGTASRSNSESKYQHFNAHLLLLFLWWYLKTCKCNAVYRSEDRRGKLREMELKVVRYQDELEAGIQKRVSGLSVAEQVQEYREHLLRKVRIVTVSRIGRDWGVLQLKRIIWNLSPFMRQGNGGTAFRPRQIVGSLRLFIDNSWLTSNDQ